jgi:cation diffusion facilitator family transporter
MSSDYDHDPPPRDRHEARTRWVVALTAVTMVVELIVGWWTRSMALTADGWHMASHVGGLGLAWLAYRAARLRARDAAFSFGTGKVFALAGFASAVLLAGVAVGLIGESLVRLWQPSAIRFAEALPVAILGLLVNLASAVLLDPVDPTHAHDHSHDHAHSHAHAHDANARAAYLHVLADALTSALAIGALFVGRFTGWVWLDALTGVVGGVVILRWGVSLARESAGPLLDMVPSLPELERIRTVLVEEGATEVIDLHLWEYAPGRRACVASVRAPSPEVERYRAAVTRAVPVTHLTIEVRASGAS